MNYGICLYCEQSLKNKHGNAKYCDNNCESKYKSKTDHKEIREKDKLNKAWNAAINILNMKKTEKYKVIQYRTSKHLLDRGMAMCSECGHLISVDYRFCKVCNDEVIILKEE